MSASDNGVVDREGTSPSRHESTESLPSHASRQSYSNQGRPHSGVEDSNVSNADTSASLAARHTRAALQRAPDTLYNVQVRGLLALVIAVAIGFLYLHLEHRSLRQQSIKLIPTSTYEALQDAKQQITKESRTAQPTSRSSSSPDLPEPEDLPSEEYVGDSVVPEKFQLHSKYLSKVVQTIGDLSRRLEDSENITRPIGGIIEMRTENLEHEEEHEDDLVPEYMKTLGNIIDDIRKSKSTPGREQQPQKFKSAIKKSSSPSPASLKAEKRKSEQAEQRRKDKEWDAFIDDLVEMIAEEEEEERARKGSPLVDERGDFDEYKNPFLSENDDDGDDEDIEEDEENFNDLYMPRKRDYRSKENEEALDNMKKWEKKMLYLNEQEDDEETDFDLDEEEETTSGETGLFRKSNIFNTKEINEGLALLKVMIEARKFVKAAKELKEAVEEERPKKEEDVAKEPEISVNHQYTEFHSETKAAKKKTEKEAGLHDEKSYILQ